MSEYRWNIDQLLCAKSLDGLTDVVREVSWSRILTDGQYTVLSSGRSSVTEPDPTSFTPFNELTEQQVISWLYTVVDVATIDASLNEQLIAAMQPPQEVVLPLPWIS
jgi:hypothetical protein